MKLETMENFVDYVRMRLGYPVVNIELADDQIKLIIEDVVCTEPPWDRLRLEKKDEVVERAYELWMRILNKYPEARKNIGKLNDDKFDVDVSISLKSLDVILGENSTEENVYHEAVGVAKYGISQAVEKYFKDKEK